MAVKKISSPSSGGIFDSGIFGFVGTTIRCDANDKSIYCSVMKFFNLVMVVCVLSYILYLIYYYLSRRKRR